MDMRGRHGNELWREGLAEVGVVEGGGRGSKGNGRALLREGKIWKEGK